MQLLTLQWLAAILIWLVSFLAGWLSLRMAKRYRKAIEIGDALANGIFIGVALFHLLPYAYSGFAQAGYTYPLSSVIFIALITFVILVFLESLAQHTYRHLERPIQAILLVTMLSIHSFIAGATLGLADTLQLFSIVFIAIMAHKAFAVFALVIRLHQRKVRHIRWIYSLFALVTPVAIVLGAYQSEMLGPATDHLLTAIFSAMASGTFIYIGGFHRHRLSDRGPVDGYVQYSKVIAFFVGATVMGVLGLWV